MKPNEVPEGKYIIYNNAKHRINGVRIGYVNKKEANGNMYLTTYVMADKDSISRGTLVMKNDGKKIINFSEDPHCDLLSDDYFDTLEEASDFLSKKMKLPSLLEDATKINNSFAIYQKGDEFKLIIDPRCYAIDYDPQRVSAWMIITGWYGFDLSRSYKSEFPRLKRMKGFIYMYYEENSRGVTLLFDNKKELHDYLKENGVKNIGSIF